VYLIIYTHLVKIKHFLRVRTTFLRVGKSTSIGRRSISQKYVSSTKDLEVLERFPTSDYNEPEITYSRCLEQGRCVQTVFLEIRRSLSWKDKNSRSFRSRKKGARSAFSCISKEDWRFARSYFIRYNLVIREICVFVKIKASTKASYFYIATHAEIRHKVDYHTAVQHHLLQDVVLYATISSVDADTLR